MRPELSAGWRIVWLTVILSLTLTTLMFSGACETSGSSTAEPVMQTRDDGPVKAETEIRIENFVFVPAETTIAAGTRVTWVNNDDAPHTTTSTDGRFNSEGLDTGDRYSFVFKEKGDFSYYCALHPRMKGVIKVQ